MCVQKPEGTHLIWLVLLLVFVRIKHIILAELFVLSLLRERESLLQVNHTRVNPASSHAFSRVACRKTKGQGGEVQQVVVLDEGMLPGCWLPIHSKLRVRARKSAGQPLC